MRRGGRYTGWYAGTASSRGNDSRCWALRSLPDHRDGSFGTAFGLLIKELRLLARSVTVVDRAGIVRYHQLVAESSSEPDYDAALAAAKQLI